MGSSTGPCALSRLPIRAGEDVVFIVLSDAAYHKENFSGLGFMGAESVIAPRSLPIFGKYDGYGFIKDFDEESIEIKSFMNILREEMVEKGIGDNSHHDHAVSKESSFGEIIDALYEGRLEVKLKEGLNTESDSFYSKETIPTVNKIVKIIKEKGFNANKTYSDFYVKEMAPGWIRVRIKREYSEEKMKIRLEKIELIKDSVCEKFATVITGPTSRYQHSEEEIQIFPKEGNCWLRNGFQNSPTRYQLYPAIIKKDVWDFFSKPKYKDKKYTRYCKIWDAAKRGEEVEDLFNVMSISHGLSFSRDNFLHILNNLDVYDTTESCKNRLCLSISKIDNINLNLRSVNLSWTRPFLNGLQDLENKDLKEYYKFLKNSLKEFIKSKDRF